jgi:hypothetical protein
MGSKISALTSAANLLGSTKKLALANAGFVVPDGWASAVAVTLTGSTSETALATIAIPAGAMGANGILRVTTLWSFTNSGNNKTLRVRLGGIGGKDFFNPVITTNAIIQTQTIIRNRNAQNAQASFAAGMSNAFTTSTAGVVTGTVDTSAAQDLVFTAQLANAGETITLESYLVEILYKA